MGSLRRIGSEITVALAVTVIVLLPSPAVAQSPGPVLVVGDSLEVGTEPYLREELAGVEVTVDALTSRPSSEGVSILQGAIDPEHVVVVFDLGTNDDPSNPEGLAANLDAAREIAGDRCMVVATITKPPLNGVSDDALNGVISRFAASTGVQVADWRAVAAEPGVLQPDGVHATAEGYARRARVVADAVRACSSADAPSGPSRLGRRPETVVGSPEPKLGPGLALLAAPVAAIFDRAARLLGSAMVPAPAIASVLDSAIGLGDRLIRRIGDQVEE